MSKDHTPSSASLRADEEVEASSPPTTAIRLRPLVQSRHLEPCLEYYDDLMSIIKLQIFEDELLREENRKMRAEERRLQREQSEEEQKMIPKRQYQEFKRQDSMMDMIKLLVYRVSTTSQLSEDRS